MDRIAVFDRFGGHLFDLADVLSATWVQEINGEDSVTVQTRQPLAKGMALVWRDATGRWHEHVVSSVDEEHSLDGGPLLTVWCELSTCELRGDYVVEERPGVQTGKASARTAMESALKSTRWAVGPVDVATLAGCSMYHESAWDAVCQVVKTWGGELEASYDVDPASGVTARSLGLRAKLGKQNATRRFEWGRDLESIKRSVDETDVVTAIYAWGKGEELDGGSYGRRIGISGVTPDGLPYVHDDEALKVWGRPDGEHAFGDMVEEDCEDPQELYRLALADLAVRSAPRVSYTASVVQFGEAGSDLAGVGLGDAVQVVDRGFAQPLRVGARVVRIETDMLMKKSPVLTLSNFVGDLSDITSGLAKQVSSLTDRSAGWDAVQSASSGYVNAVIDEINRLFASSGGYVEYDPARGITVTDRATARESSRAINLSGAGLRIANRKTSSGDWDWRTFGTGDGFLADLIVAGTLKAGVITDVTGKNYWNLDTGELRMAAEVDLPDLDGVITGVDVEYALGASQTSAPDSGWSTVAPAWQADKYMWQRTVVTDLEGVVTYSQPTCIQGARGVAGTDGTDGAPGKDGENGLSSYVHIKYAPVQNPTAAQMTESPDEYIGICTDHNQADPATPSSYTWSKFEGRDGENGIPGAKGADGRTTYVHFAYANSADGKNGFSVTPFTGAKYVGVRTDYTLADSTNPSDYEWSLFVGEDGVGVSAVVEQYYLSTSQTTQTGGSWGTAQPVWRPGAYIWTRSQVTWTDGTVTTTAPVLAKAINGANENAQLATENASTALTKAQSLDKKLAESLTQKGIFDALTNNGEVKGLFMQDGQVYINGTYIQAGTVAADFLTDTSGRYSAVIGRVDTGGTGWVQGISYLIDGNHMYTISSILAGESGYPAALYIHVPNSGVGYATDVLNITQNGFAISNTAYAANWNRTGSSATGTARGFGANARGLYYSDSGNSYSVYRTPGNVEVQTLRYGFKAYKNGTCVTVSGADTTGASVPGNWGTLLIGTLPVGWRPPCTVFAVDPGIETIYLQVEANGEVRLANRSATAFDGNAYGSVAFCAAN